MSVEHLASPQNLTPSAAVYVVWLQERGGDPQNQGQLKVDKNLKASFETVTPAKSFELFVTGERDESIKAPTGVNILRTAIQP